MSYFNLITETNTPIFLFHGVVSSHQYTVRNYLRKHIDKDYFYKTLKSLLAFGKPYSLDECIPERLENGFSSPKSPGFVVSFDDGFKNNFSIAAPILDELRIPTIFYITTGFVNEGISSWIDQIESAFEEISSLKLETPFSELNVSARTVKEKVRLLNLIRLRVKNDPSIDPYLFAQELLKQMGFDHPPVDHELDAKLSWEEITVLNRNPLFKIGGHGHTHRILSFLKPPALIDELNTSLDLLKTQAGITTRHYCYPDGQQNCYSPRVIEELKARGICCSPTAINGTVVQGTDLFHLTRTMVT